MYYVGEGELYSDYVADNVMRSDDFTAWKDDAVAAEFNAMLLDIGVYKPDDAKAKAEVGTMKIYSTTEGVKINAGATNDTSNISAICGFMDKGENFVTSSRELYCVNGESKLTQAGLFKKGTITVGKLQLEFQQIKLPPEIFQQTYLN